MTARIVHILEAYTGGTRRHLHVLLEGLTGWDQSAIVSVGRDHQAPAEVDRLRALGIPIYVVPMQRSPSPAKDVSALVRLAFLLRRLQPDIVHCHSAKAGFLGRIAGAAAGVPVRIYTPHALPFQPGRLSPKSLAFWKLEQLAGTWTTLAVAVSPTEAHLIRQARLVDPTRIRVIPNGIPTPRESELTLVPPGDGPGSHSAVTSAARFQARSRLGWPPGVPVVLCVAHLRPQKAPLDWIEMARLVARQRPDCLFAWVGDGEMEAQTIAAAGAAIPGSFLYHGYQQHLDDFYAAADVFALASLWEGSPYALLEAMAHELPCAATTVAGCQDILLHGENGLLAPPGKPSQLAASVLTLLADPAAARAMGRAARRTIEDDYSLPLFLARHDRLYREALASSSASIVG